MKNQALRYNEYYQMQPIYDNLYQQSIKGHSFRHLWEFISSDNNIMLAYRTIKRNKGSMTAGINKHTIKYWESKPINYMLLYVKSRLNNYQPHKVRRVEIPKSNGKTRPLGIPTIEDRIVQQCIKQVLEPICEAKFHPHSYGFRPNRSTSHALAYVYRKINQDYSYYMVDVDIHGFFDNVNHGKLLKQLWTLGIQDKKLLNIISAMLKAEIEGEGVPNKGVPQGGILSPLLANIVLNELDWWISDQWQTCKTQHAYTKRPHFYKHMRTTKLKEMYIVRYADDFKIICKDYDTARRAFIATKDWLMERLKLEISEEKSKIVDVRKQASEFLGFKIGAKPKRKKCVVNSHINDKGIRRTKEEIRKQIKVVAHHPYSKNIYMLNRIIVGAQNYYKFATNVAGDFQKIHFGLYYCMRNRLRKVRTRNGAKSREYLMRYGHYGGEVFNVKNEAIYPISYVTHLYPRGFNQDICNYTEVGRNIIHTKLGAISTHVLEYLASHPLPYESVELNDNRISLYVAQRGLCCITKRPLLGNMEIHHIIPVKDGGDDRYKNLSLFCEEAHVLVHMTEEQKIAKLLDELRLNARALETLNKFRVKVGNAKICK